MRRRHRPSPLCPHLRRGNYLSSKAADIGIQSTAWRPTGMHKCQKRPRNRPIKAQKRPADTGTNSAGSLVVSGSTERVSSHAIGLLRLWDPRSAQKVTLTLLPMRIS